MEYDWNPNKIIESLEVDIRDYWLAWDDELVVWGYWTIDKFGREVFFDYFRLGEEIEVWDKKVSQTHDQFFRKKMIGSELLKILKKEYQTR